ncbi:uncharacterized protein ACWYII_045000 isoform 1-T1 [Salvelinus alpinus]
MRGSWLCSEESSIIHRRAESGVSAYSNYGRMSRPLRSTPSPSVQWKHLEDAYSKEDCAKRSRRSWHAETTLSPWTHSSRWPSIWITFFGSVGTPIRLSPSFVDRSESEPEPMEVGATCLPAAERRRRHSWGSFPIAVKRGTSFNSVRYVPTRSLREQRDGRVIIRLLALVDSGAAGDFIDQALASSLNITSYLLSSLFPDQALDNRPL